MIGMIVGVNPKWVIGCANGEIPWQGKHKGDQQLFKEKTLGSVVVMGRVTWEGIPKKYRPLADRRNCVLSREGTNESLGLPSEVTVCSSIQAALEEFKEAEAIWFLGGAQVYYQAIEYATLVHMTLIPDETNLGNLVYYPEKCRKLSSHDGWQLRKMPHPHNEALVINEYFRKTPQKKRP